MSATQNSSLIQSIFNKKMLICIVIGFASGLPLYLLLQLVPAWFKDFKLDIKTIGLFTLTQLPYIFKFLWAPFLDACFPNPHVESRHSWLRYFNFLFILGRRRSWMFLTQVILFMLILSFGFFSPIDDKLEITFIAFLLSFFSATQDITLDAYRRELLNDNEQGLGNSLHVNAYRISGLIPGGLSLILAEYLNWDLVFFITALFMLPAILTTLIIKEPLQYQSKPKTLDAILFKPFTEFVTRNGALNALLIVLFLFLYKLGDSMSTALATPFYLDMGYSKENIGIVAKNAALWPSVFGGLLGGILMLKIGINRSLWLFGGVQMASTLGFVWLAQHGSFSEIHFKELNALGLVIAFESLGVGLGTAAFVAFIARTTNPLYTATQFALFTSIASIPRTAVNAMTGYLVDYFGWAHFFWLCFYLAIPGMLLLFKVAPWRIKST